VSKVTKLSLIKKEFANILIAFELLIIGYYGITLIITSFILNEAIFYRDLSLIITSSSWVPLIKLVNTLLDVQLFNQVGLIQVITAVLLLIKGLSFVDMIFLVNGLLLLYFFLFKGEQNQYFKVGSLISLTFLITALVILLVSVFTALSTLLFSNNNPLNVLPLFSTIFLFFGLTSLLISLGANGYYLVKRFYLKK
jgi:hypothetical protein